MFSPVEEIKARLDLVDFIREYVVLKKMGGNWKGLCPFHSEKTPSFLVSSEKGIWKCFGCGAGGDLFSFLMKKEGMEFPEALRTLAQRAGVVLRAQDPKVQNQRSRLLDLLQTAADFFVDQLKRSAAAILAREYLLQERKLASKILDSFSVGFAPHSWNDLSRHLLDRGFSESQILLSGLVVASEKQRDQRSLPFYDRFRGRITFPITDVHGSVIGFGARTFVKDSDEPKYINTPATMFYDKGRILFGLSHAKRAIQEKKQAILLEGYMDVLASHQAEVYNVVAPCGTAFTAEQAKLLLRYASEFVFCFDTDDAGALAEERAADVGWDAGARLFSLSPLPKKTKDVDELVRSDPALWRQHAQKSIPFFAAYEKRLADILPPADIVKKQETIQRLIDRLTHCASGVEQEHWRSHLAQRWQTSEATLKEMLTRAKRTMPSNRVSSASGSEKVLPAQDLRTRVAERIVALVSRHPAIARPILADVEVSWLPESLQDLFLQTMGTLPQQLSPAATEEFSRIELIGGSLYHDLDASQVHIEAEELCRRAQELYLHAELERISHQLHEAEAAGSTGIPSDIFERFRVVTEDLARLSV